ncbi:site-specific integrase [Streptomyces durocortorensis]|uniref:Site-specific integrase n=1 Tax=Streptomyces durocortorensis TaxID=2811104 RepID=A0ABS2I6T5_9ACTN|nr:site-specific integrase [Streptomyces durocortorensis]MBM7057547.1 site-specific integrase [Streptomyces durocortorensis]
MASGCSNVMMPMWRVRCHRKGSLQRSRGEASELEVAVPDPDGGGARGHLSSSPPRGEGSLGAVQGSFRRPRCATRTPHGLCWDRRLNSTFDEICSPGQRRGSQQRGLVPRLTKLPWIPNEEQWLCILEVARREPIRNRLMLALAYDAALRREELCLLRTDDLDPSRRMLRIRAETTKNRLEHAVPYSATTGALLSTYLAHRATLRPRLRSFLERRRGGVLASGGERCTSPLHR